MNKEERRLKTDRYIIEPSYYPRLDSQDGSGFVQYILSVPMPLDREQMELILHVVSQLRKSNDYCFDKMILETRPRFE